MGERVPFPDGNRRSPRDRAELGRAEPATPSAGTPSVALPAPAREALDSSGAPLPDAVRAPMERSFAHDFGAVRVHADDRAHRAANALHAHAFKIGRAHV